MSREQLETTRVEYYDEDMMRFWKMIAARQSIFNKKDIERLPPPWTPNWILGSFKFTNVFREQDRGTRFVTDYIFKYCVTLDQLLFNIFAYRIFNKIETYLAHGVLDYENFDREKTTELLREVAKEDTVFTNAFVVSGYPFVDGADKIERICRIFEMMIESHMKDIDHYIDPNSMSCVSKDMAVAYNWFLSINGVGPFLAYQMAVDLSYSPLVSFGEEHFVIDGPGAKRGLRRLFPDEEIRRVGYENLNMWLVVKSDLFQSDYLSKQEIKDLWKYRPCAKFTVMDLENCLCEFSKYSKVCEEEGRPRNKYDATEGLARRDNVSRDQWLLCDLQYDKFEKKHYKVGV